MIVDGGFSIVFPKLRGVVRPHELSVQRADAADEEDADNETVARRPIRMPVGKIKSDPATIRMENRARRNALELQRAARIDARAQRDKNTIQVLQDHGFGRRAVYRCAVCKFRYFSQSALDAHVCDRLGQRTIKGRTRPLVLKRNKEAAESAGASAASALCGGSSGGSTETCDLGGIYMNSEALEGEAEIFMSYSSESEDGTESEHSFAHSDDCAQDVEFMLIEEISDEEDNSAAVPGAVSAVGNPVFNQGSCRYPTARRGQRLPDEVLVELLALFPLKLKGPQVLELLGMKYPADFIEENEITARRIKNWQGAENQRRVKAAKQMALLAGSASGASADPLCTKISVAGLKDQLNNRGLKTSGVKADLVARLLEDDEARAVSQALSDATTTTPSSSKKRSAGAAPDGHLAKRRGGSGSSSSNSSSSSGVGKR